jgi:hypothetical protein
VGRAAFGCVIERCKGAAVEGAVAVGGGAENVRVPRLPPPLTRASASTMTRLITAIAANSAKK